MALVSEHGLYRTARALHLDYGTLKRHVGAIDRDERDRIASFIGHEPGKALFVGLYATGASRPLTREEYWHVPAYSDVKTSG